MIKYREISGQNVPTLRMFSARSSALKLRSRFNPCLRLSPSRMYVRWPRMCNSRLSAHASVLFPVIDVRIFLNFKGSANSVCKHVDRIWSADADLNRLDQWSTRHSPSDSANSVSRSAQWGSHATGYLLICQQWKSRGCWSLSNQWNSRCWFFYLKIRMLNKAWRKYWYISRSIMSCVTYSS
jgi:hypothetical protein